jgi:biotin carboxyl carrier protein
MSRKQLRIVCLLMAGLLNASPMLAQRGKFSAAEQQQISVPTPGLFADGDAFVVDFKAIADRDYSFPLPVGHATLIGNQSLEITTVRGDAVKAMFDGVVRLSRKHPQYGNVIVIRHDNGLETVYANNAQNMVKVGQHIQAGQTIAIVGGSADRVYCTFAAMVNGGWINPATIVDPVSHRLRRQAFQFKKNGGRVDLTVAKVGGVRSSASTPMMPSTIRLPTTRPSGSTSKPSPKTGGPTRWRAVMSSVLMVASATTRGRREDQTQRQDCGGVRWCRHALGTVLGLWQLHRHTPCLWLRDAIQPSV